MLENFKIFGIGGCGSNIAYRAALQTEMQAICIDTDSVALENKEQLPNCQTLLIDENRFYGLGTGGDYSSAKMTANDIKPELRQQLKDCSLAIVITGIGGGTGSAITPALLETARDMSIPTMVFIVFPFSIEGSEKNKTASIAVRNICDLADIYCYFKNDDLCGSLLAPSNISLYDAMEESSDHIISGITMLWRLFKNPGYINLDLATLLSCTKKGNGQFYLCKGSANGEYRVQEAMTELLNGNAGINAHANDVKHAIVGVFGGKDLRITEISDTVSNLSSLLPSDATIALGTAIDNETDGSIEIITLLFRNWVEQYSPLKENIAKAETNQIQTVGTIGAHAQTNISLQQISQASTKSPLCEIFRGTQGLIYKGENLDEPTYLRKRIPI